MGREPLNPGHFGGVEQAGVDACRGEMPAELHADDSVQPGPGL